MPDPTQAQLKAAAIEILKAYKEVLGVMHRIEKEQKDYFEKLLKTRDESKLQSARASLAQMKKKSV